MQTSRIRAALAALPLFFFLAACEETASEPTPTTGVRMAIVSGSGQSVQVDGVASDSLRVRVLGQNNVPVSNAEVMWNVVDGDGQLSSTVTRSNQWGVAAVAFSGATTSGTTVVTAQAQGADPASFLINVRAGQPANSAPASEQQITVERGEFATASVRIVDQFGNGVPGVQVTFRIVGGSANGALDMTTVSTDENGVAFVTYLAGDLAGTHTIEAVPPAGDPIQFVVVVE